MGKSTKPTLLIVTGAPATGKSFIAETLSEKLNFPLIQRDVFKEIMLDTLGWEDRESVRTLGKASYDIAFSVVEEILSHGVSVVFEANFKPSIINGTFRKVIQRTNCRTIQVFLSGDPSVLLTRFAVRAHSVNRHPGYMDKNNISEVSADLDRGVYSELDIPCELYRIDTTNFDRAKQLAEIEKITATIDTQISPNN